MIIVPLCGSVRDGRHIYFGMHTPQDTQDAELINEAADGLSLMNFLPSGTQLFCSNDRDLVK